jgi:putative endonuclease
MHFVYVLKSLIDGRTYGGLTNDIERRLKEHNRGIVSATKNRVPFQLISFFAFDIKERAVNFERYLKSASGRAFLSKRVL